jgi:hypothetical protein
LTQFQIFAIILFLLHCVRPSFYQRDWKSIDWEEHAVVKFLLCFILFTFYFAFVWYISGVLLPYLNHYLPVGVQQ